MHNSSTVPLSNGTMKALRNRVDEFADYLEHRRFVAEDVQEDDRHTPRYLKNQGAIFVVKQEYRTTENGKQRPHNLYEWNEDVRQELLDYYENRDTFPCGHRPHIWNPKGFDGLMCQHCMERGTRTPIDKELAKDLL